MLNVSTITPTELHASIHPLLTPFIGQKKSTKAAPAMDVERVFKPWQTQASKFIQFTTPENADVLILPVDWFWVRRYSWRSPENKVLKAELIELYKQLQAYGKPILTIFTGDRSCEPIPLDGAYVARESFYQSRLTAHDIILPTFTDDLQQEAGTLDEKSIKSQSDRPPSACLSFCGLALPLTFKQKLQSLVYHALQLVKHGRWDVSPYLGQSLRYKLLTQLAADPTIETEFIIRERNLYIGNDDQAARQQLRQEYIANMLSSDYVLCMRGSGNFSYRFYEALSLGKIPVLVDTDDALPFEDEIPWQTHILRIPEAEHISERIKAHFDAHTPESLAQLQASNRALWLEWFRPETYFPKLLKHIASQTQQ